MHIHARCRPWKRNTMNPCSKFARPFHKTIAHASPAHFNRMCARVSVGMHGGERVEYLQVRRAPRGRGTRQRATAIGRHAWKNGASGMQSAVRQRAVDPAVDRPAIHQRPSQGPEHCVSYPKDLSA